MEDKACFVHFLIHHANLLHSHACIPLYALISALSPVLFVDILLFNSSSDYTLFLAKKKCYKEKQQIIETNKNYRKLRKLCQSDRVKRRKTHINRILSLAYPMIVTRKAGSTRASFLCRVGRVNTLSVQKPPFSSCIRRLVKENKNLTNGKTCSCKISL